MSYRIITHQNCLDGFCSAFIFKRYFYKTLGFKLNSKEMQSLPVILIRPEDVDMQNFAFQPSDIVLDLPKPKSPVFFWCDHHSTQKPPTPLPKNYPNNYFWEQTPSCAGYLIDLAIKEGLKPTKQLLEFKIASEKIDSATYTKEEILECFFPQKGSKKPSTLLQLETIASLFSTKDDSLNRQIIQTILSQKLDTNPLQSKSIKKLNPQLFHTARLESLQKWRDCIDTYISYDETSGCVMQDDRKATETRGVVDRYYSSFKFPQCSYTLHIRIADLKTARIGLGSNIFHKDRCLVNIGKLCKDVGTKFGEGSGGGHPTVGGTAIKPENADRAIEYILEIFRKAKSS